MMRIPVPGPDRRRSGFTLIELFVVMTVIAVAAAVTFFATCFAGFWTAAPVLVYVTSAETIVWVLVIAIVIGSISAGVVGYLLIRRLWPRMD